MHDPDKFAAVSDNFIYVHRALRCDLARIMAGGAGLFVQDFPRFARVLAKHTELEDELFFPALEERAPGATVLTNGPHAEIEALAAELGELTAEPGAELEAAVLHEGLTRLGTALEVHLAEEEEAVMPAMMEHFSARELWALDGRIMEFCSPEFMAEMLPWWFIHMNAEDRVAVAGNMVVGVAPEALPMLARCIVAGLPAQDWAQLSGRVPALAGGVE